MKITKFIGLWAVVAALAVSQVPCVAEQAVSIEEADETSAEMNVAFEAVKEKITIPEGYTEHLKKTYHYYDIYDFDGFLFGWKNENASVEVISDRKGRIISYEHYADLDNRILIEENAENITIEMLREYVEKHFPEMLPEAFADENDRYEYDDYYLNFSPYEKNYTLIYTRFRDEIRVSGNYLTVYFSVRDGKLWIDRWDSGFDYDAEFEAKADELEDVEATYKNAFPIELIYVDNKVESKSAAEGDKKEIRLVYKKKKIEDYMSVYTGELYKYEEGHLWGSERITVGNESDSGRVLTELDLVEIDRDGVFKSIAECEKIVRSFTELSMGNETLNEEKSHITYSYNNNKYIWELHFEDEEKKIGWSEIDVQLDAKTGELLYYKNRALFYETADTEISQEQLSRRDEQIDAFLELTASDIIGEFERDTELESKSAHQRCYVRTANGIPYKENRITVGYDFDSDKIFYYEADYNEQAEFVEPVGIIDIKTVQDIFFEAEPKRKEYADVGDGYKLTYYMNNADKIDAFTGKTLAQDGEYEPKEVEYIDIDNHWCKAAVEYLRDMGIAFQGDRLYPDEPIKKSDMMRVFAAAAIDSDLMTANISDVYSRYYAIDDSFTQIVQDSLPIQREQAFIYMAQFMGLNYEAKQTNASGMMFDDINDFDTNYIGYAAVLSDKGIINGDGATIRPKDNITRAEALTMVYNYLTSKEMN